jgi:nicotinamidase-related amidase
MKRALLVIDVQNEYFTGKLPIKYPQASFDNILKAIGIARAHGIPVIVIQHSSPEGSATFALGTNGWELHDAIKEKRHDFLIEKTFPGSFTNTVLEDTLKKLGCDTIVITGYMTQMCCDTTARQAFHMGYKVEFISDATGAPDVSNYAGSIEAEQLHKAILVTQAMRFSRVMTFEEWSNEL